MLNKCSALLLQFSSISHSWDLRDHLVPPGQPHGRTLEKTLTNGKNTVVSLAFHKKSLLTWQKNSAFWQLLHSWPETAFSTDGCAYHVQNTSDWKYVLVWVSWGHSTQYTVARIPTWRTSLRYDSCKSWNNINIDFPCSQKSGLEPWLFLIKKHEALQATMPVPSLAWEQH